MGPRQVDDLGAIDEEDRFDGGDDAANASLPAFFECRREIGGAIDIVNQQLDAQRLRRCVQRGDLPARDRIAGIGQDQDARQAGHRLLQQLQSLGDHQRGKRRRTGYVAARPCEAGHQPGPHRIAQREHHDRYRAGCLLGGCGRRRGADDDHVRLVADTLGGKIREGVGPAIGRKPVDRQAPTIDVAEFAESIEERRISAPARRRRIEGQQAKPGHLRGGLAERDGRLQKSRAHPKEQ